MTDPQYERFAPHNARRTDSAQPQVFSGEALGDVDPRARFAPPVPPTPVVSADAPQDSTNFLATPDSTPAPAILSAAAPPITPPPFPSSDAKVSPQVNAAQREYAELLAQRRHSIDQVLQMDLEKLEHFENVARVRRYKVSLQYARIVFVVGWLAWVPFVLFLSSRMPTILLGLICLVITIGVPILGTVVFWRENNRKYRNLEYRARTQLSEAPGDVRHSAFTAKEPPVRRW